jgi:hypothetical protein
MRLLYVYPENWTGTRGRELHAMATCVALAESDVEVTLVIAGGEAKLREHLLDMTGAAAVAGLSIVELSRTLGPIQSTSIFSRNFAHWINGAGEFKLAYTTHLKAASILAQSRIPYAYEAHRIFTQGQFNPTRQRALHKLEGQVLAGAQMFVATSAALGSALNTWFGLSKKFTVVPTAGFTPLEECISAPFGPFVYCGSIGDGADLGGLLQAAQETRLPLKVVGGTEEEWRAVSQQFDTSEVAWQPQVRLSDVTSVLNGARAGVVPTNADSPSGEFACPLKLFEYARCGLPVVCTGLSALADLEVGDWCQKVWFTQLGAPARAAWIDALRSFEYDAVKAEAARIWAGGHTWDQRAEMLKAAFSA